MKLLKSTCLMRGVLNVDKSLTLNNNNNKNDDTNKSSGDMSVSEKSIRTDSTCSSSQSSFFDLDRGVRDALLDDISSSDGNSERSREFLHRSIDHTTTTNPYPAPLPRDVVDEILDSPAPYADEKQRAACRRMVVDELSAEDQEIAARTSYAYWVAANFHEEPPCEEIRIRMAMREARRHLALKLGKYNSALTSFRGAIKFRKEYNVDLLRTCFPRCSLKTDTPEIEEKRELFRSYLLHEFKIQKNVVRGEDRGGRAVALRFQRTAPTATTKPEAFAAVLYYTLERALACTEFLTRGREEKVCALADFDDFNSSNSPPVKCLKHAATIAQSVFPARLQNLTLVNPTFAQKSIFYLIRPLLSASTLSKLALAYGKDKDGIIGKYVAPENAMPFMLADGELVSEIDMDHYLNSVPFHCKYDDVPLQRRR